MHVLPSSLWYLCTDQVKNENRRGNKKVSFTKYVDVDVYGYRIRLRKKFAPLIGTLDTSLGYARMVTTSTSLLIT